MPFDPPQAHLRCSTTLPGNGIHEGLLPEDFMSVRRAITHNTFSAIARNAVPLLHRLLFFISTSSTDCSDPYSILPEKAES